MGLHLILAGIAVWGLSGLLPLAGSQREETGRRLCVIFSLGGSLAGLLGAGMNLIGGQEPILQLAWPIPGAAFSIAADRLSSWFLVPVFLIPGLANVYGLEYWPQAGHGRKASNLQFFFNLMVAAMALVAVARNAVLFLAAWEVMAVAGYFALTAEGEDEEAQEAGWVYLVATHASTLVLIGLFGWYGAMRGSFELERFASGAIPPASATLFFLLGVIGFSLKAGLMPLHVWLPSAHANAPSHVSAVFSGVLIKIGVYGVMRICWMLPDPPLWWGGLLLGAGVVSGVLGVAFAIGQHDLKRLLAYHSIENIGIIFMGLGLALMGQSLGRWELVALGLAGALLHTWNHGLFKSLLFLSAGSVIRAAGTREIDKMGGLSKRMPWTSVGFLVGAVAICGLPPLNGFVSEFFIYLGLFRSINAGGSGDWSGAVFAVPFLALIGGLALACFVKVYGAVFLGEARGDGPETGIESGTRMLAPMAVLGGCCFLIGLAPWLISSLLDGLIAEWGPATGPSVPLLIVLAPLGWMTVLGVGLLSACAVANWFLRTRVAEPGSVPTWDCGYARPSSSMQYSSSSFAQMIVDLFSWALRPVKSRPRIEGLFPGPASFHSHVPDTIMDRGILPVFRAVGELFARLRFLQSGWIQAYVLYILIAVLAAMMMV